MVSLFINRLKINYMHVKSKYITAISDSIDFIHHNVDGASEEQNENETLKVLNEILKQMEKSQYKRLVGYYVRKGSK